jgi:hypothetical protein
MKQFPRYVVRFCPVDGRSMLPLGYFPGGKADGHDPDHPSLSNSEVKNAWSYTSTAPYVCIARCLINTRTTLPLLTCGLGKDTGGR